jgi:hypothetical protein
MGNQVVPVKTLRNGLWASLGSKENSLLSGRMPNLKSPKPMRSVGFGGSVTGKVTDPDIGLSLRETEVPATG